MPAPVGAGPLRRGIGRRDKLRDNVAGGAPRRIVKGRRILLHRAARPLGITIPAPILTRDRALLVGIGLDQARINRKTFTANQTGRNARFDDPFEHATKNVSLAETLVPGARECRMIRDGILDTELAEPAIGEVSRQISRSERIAKTYPTTSIRIISSGSIEGRPMDE
jgi:hypothetical protein